MKIVLGLFDLMNLLIFAKVVEILIILKFKNGSFLFCSTKFMSVKGFEFFIVFSVIKIFFHEFSFLHQKITEKYIIGIIVSNNKFINNSGREGKIP